MVFSRITVLPLISIAIGVVVIFLGLEFAYRPASVAGLLVVAITASASITIPSLVTIGEIIKAIIGLLVPLLMLIWIALSAEEGDAQTVAVVKKAAWISVGYALICIWSVPMTILVVSLFSPTIAIGVSTLAETSIILVATIAGGMLVLQRKPAIVRPAEPVPARKG
jgi:hypothetical protein